jgi:hypothetical protein
MKKSGYIVCIFLVLFLANFASASLVEVPNSKTTFVRGTGEPYTDIKTFYVESEFAGEVILMVNNGLVDGLDVYEKVSSTVMKLNGVDILASESFNQNVDYIQKPVLLLAGENILECTLKSKPNGTLQVRMFKPIIEVQVGGHSSHFSSGYYIQLYAQDPNKLADSITVTGPGIVNPLSLTFAAYLPGEWWSVPNVDLGQMPPEPPITYTFRIIINGGEYNSEKTIESFVHELATNLSPVGNVYDSYENINFTWTPISSPDSEYHVQLCDENWNGIWFSSKATGNSVLYTGPPLSAGSIYQYLVVTNDSLGNQSMADAQFNYLGDE